MSAYGRRIMRSATTKLTAAATLVVLALAFQQPAGAHGGGAAFKVLDATSPGGRIVEIRVAITYSSDHELAEAALVQAVGHGPDGHTTAPIDLSRRPGGVYRLRTTVPAKGTWRFDVTSRFPPGSTRITVEVGDTSTSSSAVWWLAVPAVVIVGAVALVLRSRRRARGRPSP